jgi:hypothetical protein
MGWGCWEFGFTGHIDAWAHLGGPAISNSAYGYSNPGAMMLCASAGVALPRSAGYWSVSTQAIWYHAVQRQWDPEQLVEVQRA